ncbi:CotH kinase family protein [Congregibacter sp.]|uniref:CotH kinase family protein n=1 Tax=Congregibacter sp. TaxID=2744308 RepID=UPI003859D9EF
MNIIKSLIVISTLILLSACGGGGSSDPSVESATDSNTSSTSSTSSVSTGLTETDASFDTADWTEATHSNDVDPNYEEVFDDTLVKRFDFVITPDHWESMLNDMTTTYGEFGSGGRSGLIENENDPIFVPGEVFYEGTQWYRVGLRFKGNSTLQGAWQQGILKLSFKMDFDEFEDDYPQIDNQRFYGFKKFSLKNNYEDSSLMREKVASDVFRKAGLPASHTGFYSLYIDHGTGPEYFGLYTLVEEVDGEVLDTQFSNDDGNLYKPEGAGASFAAGSFDEEYFEKKTNEDEEDWSDIQSLFTALHDTTVSSDPTSWRTNLESVFNVDGFLKYLAVNGAIQNWDTYGRMTHNYYLYNDPDTSKLTWIPWDFNEALQQGKQGGALALDFSNMADNNWPLIELLYADPIYKARYDSYLWEVIGDAFELAGTQMLYDTYANLIEPYATTEQSGFSFFNGASDFYSAVTQLKAHASARDTTVRQYLDQQ